MKITFNEKINNNVDCLVIPIGKSLSIDHIGKFTNDNVVNSINEAIKFDKFSAKEGDCFQIFGNHGDFPKLILLIGYGDSSNFNSTKMIYLGGRIISSLSLLKIKKAQIITPNIIIEETNSAALIAQGAGFKNYKFNKYKTKEKIEHQLTIDELYITSSNCELSEKESIILNAAVEGTYLTRDLVSEPPNILYPESYANIIMELTKYGIEVEILGQKEMESLCMGSLLGVAQGSIREPKTVIMKYYNNKSSKDCDLALIGKGVTFDTGGISIKPAVGMEDMKYDMAGSAVVVGVMKSIALKKSNINVVGIVGLVENMPDGNAQRPSDVVTSMSGQTIEVLNTDAEGRLVLADILYYAKEKFNPKYMINLATLTGAITVTFGFAYAGLFSNNDDLANKLFDSGIKSDEKVWRLPMGEYYDKMLYSEIADMRNISTEKGAGSITAAQFLQRFVGNTSWAHLDIAGMSWTRKDGDIVPKGATAFGLRLLDQFIKDHIEK